MSSSQPPLKRDAGGEPIQQNAAKRHKADPTPPQCGECQGLDLDALFAFVSKRLQEAREGKRNRPTDIFKNAEGTCFYDDAIYLHGFGDRLAHESSCPLCTFFRAMRMQPGQHERYKLLGFPSSESWMWRADILKENPVWNEMEDPPFMAVVPDDPEIPRFGHEEFWMVRDIPQTGIILRLPAGEKDKLPTDVLVRPNELDPDAALKLAKSWLGMCQKHHNTACGVRGRHEPVTRGFRLIDCLVDPPKVEVHPWGTKYVALSYVWGTSPADLVDWPKTVMDAVAVTKEMRLQYLWVDRLCINQSDADEKAYLISKMTTIYEEAELTIITTAGSGAAHGLPGIRGTPRTPQPKYPLPSGATLLSSLRDPRYDILSSAYHTRGWTYQEGVLSNRRLIFTPHQLYWECRNMAAQESLAIPLFHQPVPDAPPDSDDLVMADFMITGLFKSDAYSGGFLADSPTTIITDDDFYRLDYGFPPHLAASTRAQLRGLNEHIRAYSQRRLTHDGDALLAFLGIKGLYTDPSLYLLHGLPIWLAPIAGGRSGPRVTLAFTLAAWHHRAGAHSMFVAQGGCRRRAHLPSWTWAGWTGAPVSWRALPNHEHGAQMADFIALGEGEEGRGHLLWAADLFLFAPGKRGEAVKVREDGAGDRLRAEGGEMKLIGMYRPWVLKYFRRERVKEEKKPWRWARMAGREGRDQRHAESHEWDSKWCRVAGRLCCVCLSMEMNEEEWTRGHERGELVSVLMFAGRYVGEEHEGHGGARFLTLRRVEGGVGGEERWERIGVVFLTLDKLSLDKCAGGRGLLREAPVREWQGMMVVQ
ncbi:heterokaryon incompatibility protein [Staphylotrichum tortipilum]|uniref:Heterokaryon incompatibility protein n=1 Tax=Staphylotrichum tortipilum TaxID=2831512 RepID=A0AAN6ME56_9PEZI|nr:heterokaryon incompatibility protein [Staphylotrichum longicolle]